MSIKFDIWALLENLSRKFKIWLKTDKNSGHFTWRLDKLQHYLAQFLEWEMFRLKLYKNQNTYCVFGTSSLKSCRFWSNVEKYGRATQATDDSIIQRIHIAWCISKATHTQSECVTRIAFIRQQWLRERASMLLCTCNSYLISVNNINSLSIIWKRSGAVGWGTALQAGRSRVRFPMEPLEFFSDIVLQAALWLWSRLSP